MNKELSTVFIIDGDHDTNASTQLMVESAGIRTKCFNSAEELLSQIEPDLHADCVACAVTDVLLPGMSGLTLQANLNMKHINLPLIFVTAAGDIGQCAMAMKAGAIDFMEKPCEKQRLLNDIHEALELDRQWYHEYRKSETCRQRLARLTRRERQVMMQLVDRASSASSQQIAERLHISKRTVEHHRAAIKEKMQAHSLLELVDMARICEFQS